MNPIRRFPALAALTLALAACEDADIVQPRPGFLGGTPEDAQIGLVVNSLGRSLHLFQLGDPEIAVEIPFGASSDITPVGFSVRDQRAAVPLGNAASVAIVNLEDQSIERFFLFASGNATGSAFVNDTTVLAANLLEDRVGRFTLGQASDTIRQTVAVAQSPTAIVMANDRALVVSSLYDFVTFQPSGRGVVTALDPQTLQVLGTVQTGGESPTDAALGPDGLLYVIHSGRFDPVTFQPLSSGVLTLIDPRTLSVVANLDGFGEGPGSIHIDERGLAYISGYSFGTLVWDTRTRRFVRGPDNPVCVRVAGACRGAASAVANRDGDVYQANPSYGTVPSWVYVFDAPAYTLTDSIAAGTDPTAIRVETF